MSVLYINGFVWYCYCHMVAQIPYIVSVHVYLLAPVCVDGEMIVIALEKDETDVAHECALFLIVEKFNLIKCHSGPDEIISVDSLWQIMAKFAARP